MTYKEHMMETLTNLLEEDETLTYPIYGCINQGSNQYYGYFGFTENYLLIALLSGIEKRIAYTTRLPLDVKSISVKQTAIIKQYVIDISFNSGAPCRITASSKILAIDTQKENVIGFLERLHTIAPETKSPELKKLLGEKIRTQYFNYFLGVLLSFVPMVPVMVLLIELKEGGKFVFSEFLSAFLEVLPITATIWGIILIPLFLLSFLNRFLFGKVICVLDDKGMCIEGGMLPWSEIKGITFKIAMYSRFGYRPNCATFIVRNEEEYEVQIMHFPLYGLRKIKKYCPDIETRILNKGWLIFLALCPTIISIIIPLVS